MSPSINYSQPVIAMVVAIGAALVLNMVPLALNQPPREVTYPEYTVVQTPPQLPPDDHTSVPAPIDIPRQSPDIEAEILQVQRNLDARYWKMGLAFVEHIRYHHHCDDPRLHDPASLLYGLCGNMKRARIEAALIPKPEEVVLPAQPVDQLNPGFAAYRRRPIPYNCHCIRPSQQQIADDVKLENSRFKIAWHMRAKWALERKDFEEYKLDKAAEAKALD